MRVRYDALALERVLLACGSVRYGDGAGAAPLEVWGFYRAEGLGSVSRVVSSGTRIWTTTQMTEGFVGL